MLRLDDEASDLRGVQFCPGVFVLLGVTGKKPAAQFCEREQGSAEKVFIVEFGAHFGKLR
jgi:hypothetical protein